MSQTIETIRRLMGTGQTFGVAPVADDLTHWAVYELVKHPANGPDPSWVRDDASASYPSRELAIAAVMAIGSPTGGVI